jgi:hypothetical protein
MAGFEPAASCSQSRRANQAALHPVASTCGNSLRCHRPVRRFLRTVLPSVLPRRRVGAVFADEAGTAWPPGWTGWATPHPRGHCPALPTHLICGCGGDHALRSHCPWIAHYAGAVARRRSQWDHIFRRKTGPANWPRSRFAAYCRRDRGVPVDVLAFSPVGPALCNGPQMLLRQLGLPEELFELAVVTWDVCLRWVIAETAAGLLSLSAAAGAR